MPGNHHRDLRGRDFSGRGDGARLQDAPGEEEFSINENQGDLTPSTTNLNHEPPKTYEHRNRRTNHR
jgi:hypothetical protein